MTTTAALEHRELDVDLRRAGRGGPRSTPPRSPRAAARPARRRRSRATAPSTATFQSMLGARGLAARDGAQHVDEVLGARRPVEAGDDVAQPPRGVVEVAQAAVELGPQRRDPTRAGRGATSPSRTAIRSWVTSSCRLRAICSRISRTLSRSRSVRSSASANDSPTSWAKVSSTSSSRSPNRPELRRTDSAPSARPDDCIGASATNRARETSTESGRSPAYSRAPQPAPRTGAGWVVVQDAELVVSRAAVCRPRAMLCRADPRRARSPPDLRTARRPELEVLEAFAQEVGESFGLAELRADRERSASSNA